jgi:hypothetical protein
MEFINLEGCNSAKASCRQRLCNLGWPIIISQLGKRLGPLKMNSTFGMTRKEA